MFSLSKPSWTRICPISQRIWLVQHKAHHCLSRFWSVGINLLYVEKDPCTICMGLFYVNWSLYYMNLSYVLPFMGIFLCTKFPILHVFLCTKPPSLSCVLLCPFYIRWSLIYRHTYCYESILCTPIILGSYSCTYDGPLYIWCHTYYYGPILCTPIIVGSYSCT